MVARAAPGSRWIEIQSVVKVFAKLAGFVIVQAVVPCSDPRSGQACTSSTAITPAAEGRPAARNAKPRY